MLRQINVDALIVNHCVQVIAILMSSNKNSDIFFVLTIRLVYNTGNIEKSVEWQMVSWNNGLTCCAKNRLIVRLVFMCPDSSVGRAED